jgi:hypothetical protein
MSTGVDVSKVVAYALTGSGTGVSCSKLVAYVLLEPGTESGGTPPTHFAHSYAQILTKPNPVNAGP